jgi:pimeloyl-ACP methyl ester carboxylesterase
VTTKMTLKTTTLHHGRIALALHQLSNSEHGWPLLLLHGLGERSPDAVGLDIAGWNGSIFALDFTGHGDSQSPVGGGYSAEILMADVDTALSVLGPCTILGRGLGGYIALLIAGARPSLVRGAIIDDGLGLMGGGGSPGSIHLDMPNRLTSFDNTSSPDPYALLEMSSDIRPADYASSFAFAASQGTENTVSVAVVAKVRPTWLSGIIDQFGVEEMPLTDALAVFAGAKY